MGIKTGWHSRYDLKYHFVWCPKYRKFFLKGNIEKYLRGLINEIAERYDFELVELAVMPDHIHMFVSATPNDSPSKLIQTVKSITAKKLFEKFLGIKRYLWGGALWARGYFVMSSGTRTTDEMIRHYIRDQHVEANEQPNLFGWQKPPSSARR